MAENTKDQHLQAGDPPPTDREAAHIDDDSHREAPNAALKRLRTSIKQPDDEIGDIALDRLDGAKQIARFVYGSDDTEAVKRTYNDIAARRIPATRWGGRLVASKNAIRARWAEIVAVSAARPEPPEPERLLPQSGSVAAGAPPTEPTPPRRKRGRPPGSGKARG